MKTRDSLACDRLNIAHTKKVAVENSHLFFVIPMVMKNEASQFFQLLWPVPYLFRELMPTRLLFIRFCLILDEIEKLDQQAIINLQS